MNIAALLKKPCLIEQVEGVYVVEPLKFIHLNNIRKMPKATMNKWGKEIKE